MTCPKPAAPEAESPALPEPLARLSGRGACRRISPGGRGPGFATGDTTLVHLRPMNGLLRTGTLGALPLGQALCWVLHIYPLLRLQCYPGITHFTDVETKAQRGQ